MRAARHASRVNTWRQDWGRSCIQRTKNKTKLPHSRGKLLQTGLRPSHFEETRKDGEGTLPARAKKEINVEKRMAEKRWIDERIKRPECTNPHPSYPQISCISLDKYIFPNLPQIHCVRQEKCMTLIVTDRYGVRRIEESKKRRIHCNVIATGF